MADRRVQLIRNARLRLGEAPRKIDRSDRYLRVSQPLFALGSTKAEKAAYKSFASLLECGKVVWGAITLARTDLFGAGSTDGRGVIVYSPHLHLHDNLEKLIEVSQEVMNFREQQPADHQAAKFKKCIENNNVWFEPQSLLKSITTDDSILVSSVLVVRKHLPSGRLLQSCVPLLVDSGISSVAILPHRYWPEELIDFWRRPS